MARLGCACCKDIDEIIASDVDFVIVTTPPNARLDIVERWHVQVNPF